MVVPSRPQPIGFPGGLGYIFRTATYRFLAVYPARASAALSNAFRDGKAYFTDACFVHRSSLAIRMAMRIGSFSIWHSQNSKHSPALLTEGLSVSFVACHIAIKFNRPVLLIRLRTYGLNASGMLMPEAPMDKDNCPMFRKNNIRPAGKSPLVKPKPEPHSVQQ